MLFLIIMESLNLVGRTSPKTLTERTFPEGGTKQNIQTSPMLTAIVSTCGWPYPTGSALGTGNHVTPSLPGPCKTQQCRSLHAMYTEPTEGQRGLDDMWINIKFQGKRT